MAFDEHPQAVFKFYKQQQRGNFQRIKHSCTPPSNICNSWYCLLTCCMALKFSFLQIQSKTRILEFCSGRWVAPGKKIRVCSPQLNLTSPLCRKWSWKSFLPPNDVCETLSGTIALNQLATKTNFITADSNKHNVSFSQCPSALMDSVQGRHVHAERAHVHVNHQFPHLTISPAFSFFFLLRWPWGFKLSKSSENKSR